jgi:large subunit ribosomal protein L22
MAKYNYSYKNLKENMARAVAIDAPISTKTGIEIANFLRGKSTDRAKTILENVIALKEAIPFKRFTNGPGHKRGRMASGKYPVKAAAEFLKLVKSAETNAQDKGLALDLNIIHLSVQKAAHQFHYGRQARRLRKNSHIEIVVEEKEGAKRIPKEKKTGKEEKKAAETAEKPKKEKTIKGRFIRSEEEKKALEEETMKEEESKSKDEKNTEEKKQDD